MEDIRALFLIGLTAVLAPLLALLPAFIRTPVVGLELVLGILIGSGGARFYFDQGTVGLLGRVIFTATGGLEMAIDEGITRGIAPERPVGAGASRAVG